METNPEDPTNENPNQSTHLKNNRTNNGRQYVDQSNKKR